MVVIMNHMQLAILQQLGYVHACLNNAEHDEKGDDFIWKKI